MINLFKCRFNGLFFFTCFTWTLIWVILWNVLQSGYVSFSFLLYSVVYIGLQLCWLKFVFGALQRDLQFDQLLAQWLWYLTMSLVLKVSCQRAYLYIYSVYYLCYKEIVQLLTGENKVLTKMWTWIWLKSGIGSVLLPLSPFLKRQWPAVVYQTETIACHGVVWLYQAGLCWPVCQQILIQITLTCQRYNAEANHKACWPITQWQMHSIGLLYWDSELQLKFWPLTFTGMTFEISESPFLSPGS